MIVSSVRPVQFYNDTQVLSRNTYVLGKGGDGYCTGEGKNPILTYSVQVSKIHVCK